MVKTGRKLDTGKPIVGLMPPRAILEIARVMTFGATKYDAYNWCKGLKYVRLYSAAQRHLLSWLAGNDNDDETGISHLAHACCNLMMILEFEVNGRTDLDDRYRGEPKDE